LSTRDGSAGFFAASVADETGEAMSQERHELEIVIDAKGRVTVEVKGAKGSACLEYVDFFEKNVGRVRQKRLTPEYYEPGRSSRLADSDTVRGRRRTRPP